MEITAERNILFDDDADFTEPINLILEREGFEVFTTLDKTKALGFLFESNPELVLLDIIISQMDGWLDGRVNEYILKPISQ